MPAPLDGAKLKVERAKRHIRDLEAEITAFHGRNPYVVVAEDDPQTGDQIFRVRIREQVPVCLSTTIGDIIHNLRVAFDLIASDLVPPQLRTESYFPVSWNPDAFKTGGLKKIKGASQNAVALVERLQPYHAGNDAIAKLHRLDILDKHQSIIPVGAASVGVELGMIMRPPWADAPIEFPPFIIRPANRQYPLQDGAIIFTVRAAARQTEPQANYKFHFDVAFGEGQIVDGESVVPTLAQLGKFTEDAVNLFSRELFP